MLKGIHLTFKLTLYANKTTILSNLYCQSVSKEFKKRVLDKTYEYGLECLSCFEYTEKMPFPIKNLMDLKHCFI